MVPIEKEKVREIAAAYLRGEILPIETALKLTRYWDDNHPKPLCDALEIMLLVSSEADGIFVGDARDLWHPDVKEKEDRRHDKAQAWAAPLVKEACEYLVTLT